MAMSMNDFLQQAVSKGASDLHLAVGLPPIVRIDGELQPLNGQSALTAKNVETLIASLISKEEEARFEKERDFDFAYELPDFGRFRINVHFEKNAMGLVARVVPEHIPTLQEIGMPEVVTNLARLNQGLILVTGPTGHGKSTSMAAMIDLINAERAAHIMTLEDPIEFLFTSKKSIIKQRQLGSDMLSFADGLKHVLRQDPNVIMVGEMRDLETVSAAISVAETGHLVLATLHTFNAGQTIDRIIDIFPPYQQDQVRLQLSLSLKAVISQRLLAKVGGGRVAAREILINTPAISNMIRENKIAQLRSAVETGAADGMRAMDQDIIDLVKQGAITAETAAPHMVSPERLDKIK